MCDYSLYLFPNRLACDGEELVAYRFSSGCTGFISVADMPEPHILKSWLGRNWPQLRSWFLPRRHDGPKAVCIAPGARLTLKAVEHELCERLGLEECEQAVFIQVTADDLSYRDGLRFRNGRQILVQGLPPGQRVRIISTSGLQDENDETAFAEVLAYD